MSQSERIEKLKAENARLTALINQPLNIDDISDKTILKIVGAFWRRAVPREIPLPESIVSITAMRTSLMWIDMDRYEDVELAKNHPLVFAVDSEGGHCD